MALVPISEEKQAPASNMDIVVVESLQKKRFTLTLVLSVSSARSLNPGRRNRMLTLLR
jgi:hypothetical protein